MQGFIEDKGGDIISEIFHQPEVLMDTYGLILEQRVAIKSFLDKVYGCQEDVDIILTGAGSSAFIGEALEGLSNEFNGRISRAIATTDILTNQNLYLAKNKRTLLVSFARSGDSPESVAVVDLANKYCDDIFHLVITCNKDGVLPTKSKGENCFVILLPPNSNDKSLAMTSSFTAMMLAYLLVVKIENVLLEKEHVIELCRWINTVLGYKSEIKKIAAIDFSRAVFLGSGYMLGIARESHLKLQELTDGRVICKHDSYLGFRHGPKVIVNDETLIVYLISNKLTTNNYEFDLIKQIEENQDILAQVIISSDPVNLNGVDFNLKINYKGKEYKNKNEYLSIAHVVFAQLLGYYKSLDLGLDPDYPSESGKISRVVKGVNIY